MKNSIFALMIGLVAGTMTAQAEVYSGTCGANLTWSLNTEDSTLVIEGSGQMNNFEDWGNYVVPWWRYATNIAYVSLPENISSIGNRAFEKCTDLRSIVIPNNVTSIGYRAFYECSNLSSITLGNNLTLLGGYAFYKCTQLTSVDLTNVKDIQYSAFNSCENLSSVTLGNNLTHIGEDVFYKCAKLESIDLPGSLKIIESYAFANSGLKQVTIPNQVEILPWGLFNGCAQLESVQVGEGVTEIQGGCFSNCPALKEVHLSDNVTTIAGDAFSELNNLTSPIANSHIFIRLPMSYQGEYSIAEGTETIVDNAFAECTGLTAVSIPNSVTQIGTNAFMNCSGLQAVTIPENVEELRNATFSGCKSLTTVSLPKGLRLIGEAAFADCVALNEITVPEGLSSLGLGAFSNTAITTIHWNAISCSSCTWTFYDGCTKSYSFPIHDLSEQLTTITFGDKVQYIPEQMCYDLHLLQSVKLPESLTHIGEFAFAYCTLLDSINIPAGVVEIGRDAFDGCAAMKAINVAEDNENYSSIDGVLFNKDATRLIKFPGGREGDYTIPDGTKVLEQMAFNRNNLLSVTIPESVDSLLMYCLGFSPTLSEIHFLSPTPPYIEMYAFDKDFWTYNFPYKYFVPCGSGDSYKTAINEAMQYNPMHQTFVKQTCDYVLVSDFHYEHQHTNCENRVIFYDDSYVAIRNRETGELTPSSLEPQGHLWNFGDYTEYSNSGDDSPTYTYPSYGGSYTVTMHVYYDEELYDIVTKTIELPLLQEYDTIGLSIIEEGQPVVLGGKTIFPTGSLRWTDTLQNIYGCDSIVTQIISTAPENSYTISYVGNELQELAHEPVLLHFPEAPQIAGFTFVGWRPVADVITDTIRLQAVYTSDTPTSAPAEYINPANRAQKLIREGNVYILTDTKTYTIQGQEVK